MKLADIIQKMPALFVQKYLKGESNKKGSLLPKHSLRN